MLRLAAILLLLPPQDPDPATLALLDAVVRLDRELGDPSDVRAAAARLGHDRARILEAVRALAWEPYAGILRDAGGTLAAGGGNSIDRALLLQAMLEAGGEKTRLVRGKLAPGEGAKLLAAFRPRPAAPGVRVRPAELGLDAAPLEKLAAERARERDALVEEVLDAARPEAARLGALLGAREARPLEAPKDHAWVRVEEKGKWIDLDPSPVPLAATAPAPLSPRDLAALRRSISFRLVLNRKSGGKAEALKLLDVPLEGASLLGTRIDLVVAPDGKEQPAPEKLRGADGAARLALLKAVKVWRGALSVDGRRFGAQPFDLDGNVYQVDSGGLTGMAAGLGQGAAGLFGRAFGGAAEKPKSTLESLAFEVAVREPGLPERIHRRVLLSKEGKTLPVVRSSFLVEAAPPGAGETSRRRLAGLARNAASFRKALAGRTSGVRLDSRGLTPERLLRFAELRRRIFDGLAEGGAWTQDRLGVVADTMQLLEADGALRVRRGIDILENPVRFAGPEAAARARAAGVADTVLEAILVARSAPGETASAWPLLQRARLEGGKETVVEQGGRIVIRSSADAWWEVDPATGGCVGRAASGAGQAIIEYGILIQEKLCMLSDLAELWAAGGQGPAWLNKGASAYDTFCDFATGTWPRDMVKDKIFEMNKNLWQQTADALAGMMGEN